MSETDTQTPAELRLVQDFINSIDLAPAVNDDWIDPPALVAWLREHGLVEGDVRASAADLARAKELRESLRALCIANAGGALDPEALPRIQAAAERAGLVVRFAPDSAALEPQRGGLDAAFGRVLAILASALNDGPWSRMKACRADDCLWAFYDGSRNRSGAWCSMASCGNRAKARAFRERQRGQSPAAR
jgi:predicted RNA-binding Zn ribbon-like protein